MPGNSKIWTGFEIWTDRPGWPGCSTSIVNTGGNGLEKVFETVIQKSNSRTTDDDDDDDDDERGRRWRRR